jgi:hypothetical protein
MKEADLYLATDWGWTGYMSYFHKRQVLSLIEVAAHFRDKEHAEEAIWGFITEAQKAGGEVYVMDATAYAEPHLGWLEEQTGFGLTDLQQFRGETAFACERIPFIRLHPATG